MPRISSTTAVKQPSVANHRVRSKPAWSDYLTEDNRFALTKAEVLRRKKTLLSKNNVFNTVSKLPNVSAHSQNDHPNPSVNSRRSEVGDVRKAKTRSGELTSHVDDDAMFSEKSQSPDALDYVSKKSICW